MLSEILEIVSARAGIQESSGHPLRGFSFRSAGATLIVAIMVGGCLAPDPMSQVVQDRREVHSDRPSKHDHRTPPA